MTRTYNMWRNRTALGGASWHNFKRLLGLVVLVATAGAHAHAQDGRGDAWSIVVKPRDPAKIVQMFDENRDGKIDVTEYRLRIIKVSIELDKNGDDFISPNEIPGMGKAEFERSDRDKDGKLSTYEFATTDSLKFETLDSSGDGFITASEIESHQAKRQ